MTMEKQQIFIVVLSCLLLLIIANEADADHGHGEKKPDTDTAQSDDTYSIIEHDKHEGEDHDHHGNATELKQTIVDPWASYSNVIKTKSLSPCYGEIYYHILERLEGRLDVMEKKTVQFSLSLNKTDNCSLIWVRVFVEPVTLESAALVDKPTDYLGVFESQVVALRPGERFPTRFFAHGLFIGYSALHFQALPSEIDTKFANFNASQIPISQWITFRSGKIATHREHRPLDFIFQGFIFCLIILGNTGIGLNVNWKDIRDVLKRPIGPAIGFCCQYIVMPLTGFAVVKIIDLPPNVALGIFLLACAPGGGGSNFHSYFLGGNLPLSVTMTFISTIAAIGMMPLWVFTLGRLVIQESQSGVKLDFRGIFAALINSILPFLIGITINWRRPLLAKQIFRLFVRPLLILIFLYMITMGAFSNGYLFKLMLPKYLLAGAMLPYTGFTLGFIIALLCRQTLPFAITIAIETGIQSGGIAIATLFLSLPQPDVDIAIVGPLCCLMFTPIPLWISEIIRGVYLCIKRKRCFIFDPCRERWNKNKGDEEDEESQTNDAKMQVMATGDGQMPLLKCVAEPTPNKEPNGSILVPSPQSQQTDNNASVEEPQDEEESQ